MTGFTIIHPADIYLDSLPAGLSRTDEAFSNLLRSATRRASSNLVDVAIEERADLDVIAGDLYDSSCKDQATGQFTARELGRLSRNGVRVAVLSGNHDAESRVSRHVTSPDGAFLLGNRRCETVRFDGLGVAVHGRSYKDAATTENIAALNPALDRFESDANYAPCSLGELQSAGHDYCALGHVHDASFRSEHPHVVFPGNAQGRNIRETGDKGAMLVHVEEGGAVPSSIVPVTRRAGHR